MFKATETINAAALIESRVKSQADSLVADEKSFDFVQAEIATLLNMLNEYDRPNNKEKACGIILILLLVGSLSACGKLLYAPPELTENQEKYLNIAAYSLIICCLPLIGGMMAIANCTSSKKKEKLHYNLNLQFSHCLIYLDKLCPLFRENYQHEKALQLKNALIGKQMALISHLPLPENLLKSLSEDFLKLNTLLEEEKNKLQPKTNTHFSTP